MPGSTKGWLPVAIDFDPHTAILGEGLAHWLEVGDETLSDAFFHSTVTRLRAAVPPRREVATSLAALNRIAGGLQPVAPAGFIFHVSRCGSTLIANALKAAPGVTVVSEPPHAMQLLQPGLETGGAYAKARWARTRQELLSSLFTLMAHYRTGRPEPLIVKFPSVSTLSIATVRALWPGVPCMMVVRDPVEVVVANIGGGLWFDLHQDPSRSVSILGWDGGGMPIEDFCARALGQYHRAALNVLDPSVRVVDYEQLTPIAMPAVFDFFKVSPLPCQDDLDRTFATYSKSAGRVLAFKDDRWRKQNQADYNIRVAALRWAYPSYRELRSASPL